MPSADNLSDLPPFELEAALADLLDSALAKRGATVTHDGKPGRPDIIVDAGGFAFIVEVAKRTGADAASELPAIRDHRADAERELGKTTHVLFSCLATPNRLVRAMATENENREADGEGGRFLFLNVQGLAFILRRLVSASAELHPLERWGHWFAAWREIRDDVVSLARATKEILEGDEEAELAVQKQVEIRAQLEQEALRRDVQYLEDLLRHRNVLRDTAMHALIYITFVKLYEEKREGPGIKSRFTRQGFAAYRALLPKTVRTEYKSRTLDYLLREIGLDAEVQEAGILDGVSIPSQIDDEFLDKYVLPVLDKYHFEGTHLDALGAVFEALARRAEKDTRIGQFFTPGPIVRMAVAMAKPSPTELVLDPAAGTGRFLTASMERMLDHVQDVPGQDPESLARAVKAERLLGTDADAWIVTIAKMNMYIHGDGKTNIQHENGLFLADLSAFSGHDNLLAQVDVVLTNPPLGELNYQAYAQDVVGRGTSGFTKPSAWLRARLPILPGSYAESKAIEKAEEKIAEWEDRLADALKAGDENETAKARKWKRYHEEKRASAAAAIREGRAHFETLGNTAKGGALFLAAIKDYLKPISDASQPEEWRGGRVGIIVDEAILNTPEYVGARRFIRRNFYLKAVVSFDRDAFWYQARTTAKTSLLFLVRKSDTDVTQREPAFYCHIESIGFTRTGKPDESEIPDALVAYRQFEDAVSMSYKGREFDEEKVREELEKVEWPKSLRFRWMEGEDPGERLDYAHFAAKEVREGLPPDHATLGDYVESVVRHPEEDDTNFYPFGTIDRNSGEVTFRELTDTKYSTTDLRVIKEGDIVVSGIDLVNGAVGYAEHAVDGLVVSKEFYTLRVHEDKEDEVDPRYLALLLRTPKARELIAGSVTGTSNRTRIEDEAALLGLPMPDLPPLDEQQELADRVHRAFEARRSAAAELDEALEDTDSAWRPDVSTGRDDAISMYPLTPDEALYGFMRVDPAKVAEAEKREKKKGSK